MECGFDEKKAISFYENIIKNSKKQIEELEKKVKTKELMDYLKSIKKNYKEIKTKKYKKKFIKTEKNLYLKQYCNPGCKNTMFEKGDLSNAYIKELKNSFDGNATPLINIHRAQRKKLFGNRTNVLKDDFYYKLKTVKKLKARGAISGCVES